MMEGATSEPRLRLILSGLLFVVAALIIACLQLSLRWINRPFNGFLMARNRIVLETGPPSWSGARARVPIGARLIAIDSRPVDSIAQALDIARDARPGTSLLYRFQRGSTTETRAVAVMSFRLRDYFAVFANPFFGGLAFLLMGFTVAFLRPSAHDARALLLVSLSYGMDLVLRLDDFAGFHFRGLQAAARALAPAALLYLGAAFPGERSWIRNSAVRRIWLLFVAAGAALDVALYDRNPAGWYLYLQLNKLFLLGALGATGALFGYQYLREAEGPGREKLRLVGLGAAVAFVFPALAGVIGVLVGRPFPDQAGAMLTWVFPAALAFAIVKRSALELDAYLRRALAYTALTVAVIVAYAAVVALITSASRDATAVDSPWFTLFFSLAVLVLFRPLWELLQGWIDRLFFRSRFDFAALVQSASQAFARPLDTREIALQLRHVVASAFAPRSARIFLRDGDRGPFVAPEADRAVLPLAESSAQALGAGRVLDAADVALAGDRETQRGSIFVPLRFEGRLEGVFVLGPKQSGSAYGPRDVELLRTLANQTAIALRNAAAYRRVNEVLASLESRVAQRTRELQETQAELAASNQRLRDLDQIKTRFFADASHELRTPLTLVLGPLEQLARTGSHFDAPTRRLVELARSNAARLLVLTDTLLDLSRLDAGGMEPSMRVEPLGAVLEQAAEPFRWLAEQKQIDFEVRGTDQPTFVLCDAAMIAKVVGNLLANALKFTVRGRVELVLGSEGDRAVLRVADTGPGIPAEERPFVFDRYRQASTARRSALSGSGIGLALVKELVTLHGGDVELESEVGRGSVFTVRLPLASGDAHGPSPLPAASLRAMAQAVAVGEEKPAVRAPGPDASAASVLVVEDNPNMLEFIRQLLAGTYRVRGAADAVQALAAIREERPDLIVSDVMMPGPDGVALCRMLKTDSSWKHIPLILLTARAAMESKIAAFEAGADDYVTKPFHADELLARIAALLRARAAERELERSNRELRAAYERLAEAQAQLVQAEKLAALGTLVAGMAHEINNPVSFISSSVEMMTESLRELQQDLDRELASGATDPLLHALRKRLDYERRLDFLQRNAAICRDGVQRAVRIIADLRAFGRPATGQYRLTNLHEALDRTLRLVHGEYRDRIALERDYGDLPLVPCDDAQIGQVFLNLLINALHAIDGEGRITLRTRAEGGMAVIEVTDSGRGMDPDTLSRIFDPFFTTKDPGVGSGLGLSVSRSIVRAHGGDISARSTPGHGSTFTVRLPLEEGRSRQSMPGADPVGDEPGLRADHDGTATNLSPEPGRSAPGRAGAAPR